MLDRSYITYGIILDNLGVLGGSMDSQLKDFMLREMKLKNAITRDDLITWVRPYAIMTIKHFDNPSEFLRFLGLSDSLTNTHTIKN